MSEKHYMTFIEYEDWELEVRTWKWVGHIQKKIATFTAEALTMDEIENLWSISIPELNWKIRLKLKKK